MSDQKRSHILDHALEVFSKHGYKRVSMNDIAEAAGVSRPGLYLYFSTKEQVFGEAMGHLADRLIAEIIANVGKFSRVEDKLLYVFEIGTIKNFDRSVTSPEAREILDFQALYAKEANKKAYLKFEALLTSILKETEAKRYRLPARRVAHILTSAMRGFKQVAKDGAELRELMKDQIALVIRASDK